MSRSVLEVLERDGFRLIVRPEIGGSIARFDRCDGRPILRPVTDPDATGVEGGGCFPLVPFANRVRNGAFSFDGRDIVIEPNIPNTGRVVHGLGWQAAWTVTARDDAGITITHCHDGGRRWPWRYAAAQRFELDARGLRIELSLTNHSVEPMPAGLGLHPYFPLHGQTRLRMEATGCEGVGGDGFPLTIEHEAAELSRLAEGLSPPRNLYVSGVKGEATLSGVRSPVAISASPNLTHIVIFRPEATGFVCVEPTSHRVGALDASGPGAQAAAGIVTLGPGETMECWIGICPRSDAA